jgi:hypothetical protein
LRLPPRLPSRLPWRRPLPGARLWAALACGAALAGCSIEQRATRDYALLTDYVQAVGGMRTDYNPPDAPWSASDLERNLERIAFYSEFTLDEEGLAQREREVRLLKWDGPIRYRLVGDAVTPQDVATYEALALRLSRITGLSITQAQGDDPGNLLIMILTRNARQRAAAILAQEDAPARRGLIYRLREDDYGIPCAASVRTAAEGDAIVYGVILIKAETSGLLRESCAHEEFAQALGPGNDFALARPSIFNDDQEFATLTYHDAALLRVLYHPSLEPGMDREAGMAAARRVIARLGKDAGLSPGEAAPGAAP